MGGGSRAVLWAPPIPRRNDTQEFKERVMGTCLPPHNSLLAGQVGVSNMQLGDQGPPEETEDRFSMPLIITIVCMASFLLLVAALYGCCHQRLSHRKDQVRVSLFWPGKQTNPPGDCHPN